MFAISLSLWAVRYFHFNNELMVSEPISVLQFITLNSAILLISAGGYWINNFYDYEIDKINKPHQKQLLEVFSKKHIISTYILMNGLGLILSGLLGVKNFIVNAICILLLWVYAAYWKRKIFIGNATIAILSVLVIFVAEWNLNNWAFINKDLLYYASFCFLVTWAREVVKDIEDLEGDTIMGCSSLPIRFGTSFSKWVIQTFNLLIFISLMLYFIEVSNIKKLFLSFFIMLPTILVSSKLYWATQKKDYRMISHWYKYIFFAGIFSLLI
ncbi:MAG: hypothetical protein EAZ07_09025 [Cytophagales bacterium]|nr:MAG: hypothetical protein EAZ07_09025 [Cytophagales bacterium]